MSSTNCCFLTGGAWPPAHSATAGMSANNGKGFSAWMLHTGADTQKDYNYNYNLRNDMTTIKCNCKKCIENNNGHWWCQRFCDFTVKENVELCRQYPVTE